MRVHFIAIGGSAMHNLAIALHLKGESVSGSDDEIFDPSRGRLNKYGLLPDSIGWDANRITKDLDAIILGMHARADNPELARATELGLPIFSYPEYLYEQTKNKTRVVIGGSHGKTSITSMILHVLNENGVDNDYMVGAQLDGFECMVSLSESAKIVILEGDEYLSSPIDRRPKFHLYQPDIALISGIAWDHINVFPTFENYVEQFALFIRCATENATLIYCEADPEVKKLAETERPELNKVAYTTHPHIIRNGKSFLLTELGEVSLEIFGDHNLQNLNGAKAVCTALGVTDEQFYSAISTFGGAAKRLETVLETVSSIMYKDFAHSPSKLKATTAAVKKQFSDRKLIACMELHTFSSLNKEFLAHYDGAMAAADIAYVYFNPQTLVHKKLAPVSAEEVKSAFNSPNVAVFTDAVKLVAELEKRDWEKTNLLMMSSGNFDGIDFKELGSKLFSN